MCESGIVFDVVPMTFSRYAFDFQRFYSQIVLYEATEDTSRYKPAENLEVFKQKLTKRIFSARNTIKLQMKLANNARISIKALYTIRASTKPHSKSMSQDENEKILKRLTYHYLDGKRKIFMDNEIGTCLDFGGQLLSFTDKELDFLNCYENKGISVIGFKDRSVLKFHHNIKGPLTITADDKQIENSSNLFNSLVHEMIELNKICIARVTLNKRSVPSICALVPELPNKDNNYLNLTNRLYAISLPYADDCRKLDEMFSTTCLEPSHADVQIANNFINNMTIDSFDPAKFENPDIAKFNTYIGALALGDNTDFNTRDVLLPDYSGINKRKDKIKEFQTHFFIGLHNHRSVEEYAPILTSKRHYTDEYRNDQSVNVKHITVENVSTSTCIKPKADNNDTTPIISKETEIKVNNKDSKKFKKAIIPEASSSEHKAPFRRSFSKQEQYLFDRITTYNYNNIKIHELDDFIHERKLQFEGQLNKAEKIRLVFKYMHLNK